MYQNSVLSGAFESRKIKNAGFGCKIDLAGPSEAGSAASRGRNLCCGSERIEIRKKRLGNPRVMS